MKLLPAGLCTLALLAATQAGAEPFRIIVTSQDVPLVPNSILHLAQSEGYFDRAGVEVELVPAEQTPMAVAALRGGNGEMANISVDALFGLYLGGVTDLKAVGSTDKSIPFLIAARKGLTLDDLAGATFGVGRPNSLDHTLSWTVLARLGVDPVRLNFVPLGQPAVRARALADGQIDLTTISVGSYEAIPERDGLEVLVDAQAFYRAAPVLSKVNVVPRAVIAERGAEVEAVLEALVLAARDFAADPTVWAEAMKRQRPDIDPALLDALSPAFTSSWTVNGGLQRDEMVYSQEWHYDLEKYKGADLIVPGAWADFGPIDHVLAQIGVSEAADAVSR